MIKKIIALGLAAITLFCCALSFQSCELLSSLGIGKPGGDWKELGSGFGIHVSHRSPKLSLGDDNNNLSHVDSCEVEIGTFTGGSYEGDKGHYEFKDAAIIKTLTIDGEDYTIKVPIMSDGSAGGFTASIRLKRDVEKSKVLSGYIRNSGYQGYYRIVPHTLEEKKTYAPTCEKDGYTEFKCKDCRYVEERNIVDLLGHSYGEDGVCATCGNEKPEEDVNNNNNNNNSGNNSSGGNTGYGRIVCTHTAYLDLDVSESSFGVNSGYLEISISNPEVLSDMAYQSTKPQIIRIDNAVLDGKVLKVYYTVMGHGEADILVDLISISLNDEHRCEIHVIISDK